VRQHRPVWLGFPAPLPPNDRLLFRRTRAAFVTAGSVLWALEETRRLLRRRRIA
jgi:hypothetical protein